MIETQETGPYISRKPPGILAETSRAVVRKKYRHSLKGKAAILLYAALSRAKGRGLAFDLNIEWVLERVFSCEITGITFDFGPSKYRRNPRSPSIDRRDNSLGYTKENSRIILSALNVAINEWGEDEFYNIARAYLCAKDLS